MASTLATKGQRDRLSPATAEILHVIAISFIILELYGGTAIISGVLAYSVMRTPQHKFWELLHQQSMNSALV
jgi:hypothetical protein